MHCKVLHNTLSIVLICIFLFDKNLRRSYVWCRVNKTAMEGKRTRVAFLCAKCTRLAEKKNSAMNCRSNALDDAVVVSSAASSRAINARGKIEWTSVRWKTKKGVEPCWLAETAALRVVLNDSIGGMRKSKLTSLVTIFVVMALVGRGFRRGRVRCEKGRVHGDGEKNRRVITMPCLGWKTRWRMIIMRLVRIRGMRRRSSPRSWTRWESYVRQVLGLTENNLKG